MPDALGWIRSVLRICALEFLLGLILSASPQYCSGLGMFEIVCGSCCYQELLQKVSQDCYAAQVAVLQGQAGNLRQEYGNP